MFILHLVVGNAIFYVINSLFLGPLVVFIDKPVPEGKKIAADMSFVSLTLSSNDDGLIQQLNAGVYRQHRLATCS
jgi:hypothetical protein